VEAELNQQIVKAEKTIADLKSRAMSEVEKVAIDLASEIVLELAGIRTARTGISKTAAVRPMSKPEK
jgi:F0F1-type ATP synthase membrane subunit b/b'